MKTFSSMRTHSLAGLAVALFLFAPVSASAQVRVGPGGVTVGPGYEDRGGGGDCARWRHQCATEGGVVTGSRTFAEGWAVALPGELAEANAGNCDSNARLRAGDVVGSGTCADLTGASTRMPARLTRGACSAVTHPVVLHHPSFTWAGLVPAALQSGQLWAPRSFCPSARSGGPWCVFPPGPASRHPVKRTGGRF